MPPKKRRKRKSRIKGIRVSHKAPQEETCAEMRKNIPKELINSYLAMSRNKRKVVDHLTGIDYFEWRPSYYKKYIKEAAKYIGNDIEDPIECGKLIVKLVRATVDLRQDQEDEKTEEEQSKST